MAQNTNNQNFVSAVPQPQAISQVPTLNTTQHTAPTIQNVIPNAQVYAQQPQVIYTTPMQQQITNQQQPQINQTTNSLESSLASEFVSSLKEQAKENKTAAQTNTQQESSTLSKINTQIIKNAEQKITDIYKVQQEAEEERKKEFKRLQEENERYKKEEEGRKQKEENDKILENERSKLEDQQNQINDTFEALESVDTSAFTDPNALRNYLDEIDNISDIRKFRKLVEEGFEDRTNENKQYKEQNYGYLKTLEDKFSENQRELTNKQSELNMLENNKSIFRKFIEWITGSKDEKAEKLKEKIQKLRDDIKNDMVDIDKQKEVLKNIVLEGVEIIKERNEKIKELQDKEREERDEKRKMVKGYKGTEEYNKIQKFAVTGSIKNKMVNIKNLVALQNSVNKHVTDTWGERYPEKNTQNEIAENNLNSINEQKKKKGNGRGW